MINEKNIIVCTGIHYRTGSQAAVTNHLPPSASSGAPSSNNNFTRFTPKLGATYNYKWIGLYANYSQGFVPPQVTELYNSVKVPYLQPQMFFNYEAGGWFSFLQSKLYADWSVYLLDGTQEIMSVLQDNGTYQNQNAGKTRHRGIEYGAERKYGSTLSMCSIRIMPFLLPDRTMAIVITWAIRVN